MKMPKMNKLKSLLSVFKQKAAPLFKTLEGDVSISYGPYSRTIVTPIQKKKPENKQP